MKIGTNTKEAELIKRRTASNIPKPKAQITDRRKECAKMPDRRPPMPAKLRDIPNSIAITAFQLFSSSY
jgi:hypothetical protein